MEVADVGGSRRGIFHPSRYAGEADGRVSGVFPAGSRRSAQGRNSDSQVGIIMIKSDAQRERTAAQIEGFRQALAKVDREMTGKRAEAVRGSYEGMIRQLEDELREYDELKSGKLTLPNVERLGSDRAIRREDANCQGRISNRTRPQAGREQTGHQPVRGDGISNRGDNPAPGDSRRHRHQGASHSKRIEFPLKAAGGVMRSRFPPFTNLSPQDFMPSHTINSLFEYNDLSAPDPLPHISLRMEVCPIRLPI